MTDKQKMFVNEYLIDFNATQAAIRAGYSKKYANRMASKNLSKIDIQKAIDAAQNKRAKKSAVTEAQVIKELSLIAFSDITDYADIEVTPSITIPGAYERSITMRNTADIPKDKVRVISSIKEGQCGIEIKLYDKLKALELLGRHLAMFSDKVELTGKDGEDLIIKLIKA